MPCTLSVADRRCLLEDFGNLIVARRQVLRLLIDHLNGNAVHPAFDAAILDVKRAAHKLSRHHPDAELLPLVQWSEIGELGILSDFQRGKKANMSDKEIIEWRSNVVSAMSGHTERIVSELKQQRASHRTSAKVNPRDKYCYEGIKKGDSLKEIMDAVNVRRQWEPLTTVQGVSQAAKRHAEKHGLKWPLR
jgi:hypothetical protein